MFGCVRWVSSGCVRWVSCGCVCALYAVGVWRIQRNARNDDDGHDVCATPQLRLKCSDVAMGRRLVLVCVCVCEGGVCLRMFVCLYTWMAALSLFFVPYSVCVMFGERRERGGWGWLRLLFALLQIATRIFYAHTYICIYIQNPMFTILRGCIGGQYIFMRENFQCVFFFWCVCGGG